MSAPKRQPASRLESELRAGRFVLTAEVAPPVSCSPDDLLAKALPLRGLADAVNVTDGAGAQVALAAGTAAALLVREGVEPILQFTCRDRNRIALQSELLAAAANGVVNLLALTGDKPGAGDEPDAKPVFDLDTVGLLSAAGAIRDRGELLSGKKVGGAARFFLGAADMPVDPPAGWKPTSLRAKIAAGAEFAQTQFCMDASVVRRYAVRLAEDGVLPGFKLIVGIAPLRSARAATWMRNNLFGTVIPDAVVARMEKAADPGSEGKRIAVELIEELRAIPGIAGVHLMAPGNDRALPEVLAEARKRLQSS